MAISNKINFFVIEILLFEEILIRKKYLGKSDIKNIKIKINKEISQSFDYAKKSEFPIINSLEDLNLNKETPVADKILKDMVNVNFDSDQKVILPKGY